jgi:hypothetical protein
VLDVWSVYRADSPLRAIIDDWAAAGLTSEAELQQRYCALAIVPALVSCIWQELWHATTQVSRRRELDAAARRRHKAAAVQRDAELKRKRDADAAEQRAREAAAHEQCVAS